MADEAKLTTIHDMVCDALIDGLTTKQMEDYIDPDTGETSEGMKMPPSAAIIQAATKFLKDNNITCTPAKDNKLGELQAIMEARQAKKRERMQPNVVDLEAARETQSFLDRRLGHA